MLQSNRANKQRKTSLPLHVKHISLLLVAYILSQNTSYCMSHAHESAVAYLICESLLLRHNSKHCMSIDKLVGCGRSYVIACHMSRTVVDWAQMNGMSHTSYTMEWNEFGQWEAMPSTQLLLLRTTSWTIIQRRCDSWNLCMDDM